MAYLRGYDHDVFVSYSLTNDKLALDDQPWVTRLVDLLKVELENRLQDNGKEVEFYFAGRGSLRPGDQLASCRTQAGSSALFLIIGSPRYLDVWPTSELRAFVATPGASDRIFIAELLPLGKAYPAEIGDPRSSKFWKPSRGQAAEPFTNSDGECYTQLVELADAIVGRLGAMHERESLPTKARGPDPYRRKVLIARATDALWQKSQAMRSHLEGFGVEVLPAEEFEATGQAFKDEFEGLLGQKPIVVQLLGEYPARPHKEVPEGYDVFQAAAASDRKVDGVDLFQWRDPRLKLDDVEDEAHRELLAGCGEAMDNFEEFKELVEKATLIKPPPPPHPPGAAPAKKQSFWFIDADMADDETLKEVISFCDKHKIRAIFPEYGVDQEEDWRSNYTDARAIAMIHRRSESKWLRPKLRLFMKTSLNPDAAQRCLVYLAGPPPKERDCVTIAHEGLEVIFAPDGELTPLLDKLT